MNIASPERSKVSIWFQAIRPFSLTAIVIPVLLGAIITLTRYSGEVPWLLMIVIVLGAPLFQISGNLISDYYDYVNRVDRPGTFGSSGVLINKLLRPKSVLRAGIGSLAILFLIGLILVYFRGLDMLIIGLIGLAAAYLYTAFKYRALGDVLIYLTFAPLTVLGTVFALTGSYSLLLEILVISLPIGFLVVAILHANNARDISYDLEANITTLAIRIGFRGSQIYYYFLIVGAYLSVFLSVLFNFLPWWTLLIFLSMPIAVKNIKTMASGNPNDSNSIAMLDVMTAQLHLVFGILLCAGILIEYFF